MPTVVGGGELIGIESCALLQLVAMVVASNPVFFRHGLESKTLNAVEKTSPKVVPFRQLSGSSLLLAIAYGAQM